MCKRTTNCIACEIFHALTEDGGTAGIQQAATSTVMLSEPHQHQAPACFVLLQQLCASLARHMQAVVFQGAAPCQSVLAHDGSGSSLAAAPARLS